MPTLWTFGDSFTAGHGMNGEIPEYTNAHSDLKWTNLLAKELGCELKNFGANGLPNETILQKIIECLNEFNSDDTIIIESSTLGRMVVPESDSRFNHNKVHPVYIHQNTIDDEPEVYLKHFSRDELKYIIGFFENFVLDGFYYTNEVKSIIALARYLNDKKIVKNVIYWNLFPIESIKGFEIQPIYKKSDELDEIYLKNKMGSDTMKYGWIEYFKKLNLTIKSETNGRIDDLHLSKYGHDVFFRLILSNLGLKSKTGNVI